MKIPKLVGTLCGAALFFASGVVAGELNKTAIHLDENVTLEGKILNIGNYTAEWKGSGPNVQVTLLKGKDAIATFPARLKDENNPNAKNAYGFTVQPDGSKELTSIFPGGKRFELQIDQKASPALQSGTIQVSTHKRPLPVAESRHETGVLAVRINLNGSSDRNHRPLTTRIARTLTQQAPWRSVDPDVPTIH